MVCRLISGFAIYETLLAIVPIVVESITVRGVAVRGVAVRGVAVRGVAVGVVAPVGVEYFDLLLAVCRN